MVSRFTPGLLAILTLAGSARADIDLTGRWFTPQSTTRFADIVQAGSDVSITFQSSGGPVTYTGTFDQETFVATSGPGQLHLAPRANGDILYGRTVALSFPATFLVRCECDDGNTDDGDGCDSECRIEECYTCTGEPSACVPSADAAPCDDRSQCTTGETCTSGSCGSASPIPSCIDLSGSWRVHSDGYFDSYFSEEYPGRFENLRFLQQDGTLLIYDEQADPGAMPKAVGTIDPSSGEMSYAATTGGGLCSSVSSFDGTASGDASSFEGSTAYYSNGPPSMPSCSATVVDATGTRCHATLGCALADCSGLPDGTPCSDGDVCTDRDACNAGTCVAQRKCPLCQSCDSTGDCDVGPSACRWPMSTQLAVTQSEVEGRDLVRWSWKKGAATSVEDFGDPATTTGMALCVFNDYELVYKKNISPDEACEEPPCWMAKGDRLSFKGSQLALTLRAGDEGSAMISLKSREELPESLQTPMFLPIRAQLQFDNGVCFDSAFAANGVSKNDNGKFKAKGFP